MGIISKGKMVFQGTLNELTDNNNNLQNLYWKQMTQPITGNMQATVNIISGNGKNNNFPVPSREKIAVLNRELVNSNINVLKWVWLKRSRNNFYGIDQSVKMNHYFIHTVKAEWIKKRRSFADWLVLAEVFLFPLLLIIILICFSKTITGDSCIRPFLGTGIW